MEQPRILRQSSLHDVFLNAAYPPGGPQPNVYLPGWGQLATFRAVLAQTVQVAFPIRVREVVMMGRYPHF